MCLAVNMQEHFVALHPPETNACCQHELYSETAVIVYNLCSTCAITHIWMPTVRAPFSMKPSLGSSAFCAESPPYDAFGLSLLIALCRVSAGQNGPGPWGTYQQMLN